MKHSQDGFGIIGLIFAVGIISGIVWFIYGAYFNDTTSVIDSSQQIIEDAGETIDKANTTKEQAEGLIDSTN